MSFNTCCIYTFSRYISKVSVEIIPLITCISIVDVLLFVAVCLPAPLSYCMNSC